jgi:pyruvate dehydrogenase E1 component alpha subunit
MFKLAKQQICRQFSASAASNTSSSKTLKHNLPLFKTHNLTDLPSSTTATKDELLDFYYKMTVIRRMEIAADNLYKSKNIRGFCHLATGQEAIPAGMEAAIEKSDSVITAYRCHGFAYIRGASVKSILAELTGAIMLITRAS